MPWKTLLSAGASAYATWQNNRNVDKQLQAQKEENAKNRKYNLELAKLQNSWNRQQWQMENAYNSPAAQMERMRQAGLNPDMMYGGGLEGNLSAPSPEMTSGVGSSPMSWSALGSKKTIGDTILQAKQLEMMDAQVKNVEADTRNKGIEGDILESDAKFRDAMNQGQLDLTYTQIRGIDSNIQLNDEQISKIRAEVKNLDQQCENLKKTYDLLQSQINNYDADTAYKRIRAALDSKETDALVAKMAADTNLSKAECRAIVSRLPWELLQIKNQGNYIAKQTEYTDKQKEYTEKQTEFVKLENDVLTWQWNMDQSYEDYKRSLGLAGQVIDGLEGAASIIGMAFGSGRPTRVRGFGR